MRRLICTICTIMILEGFLTFSGIPSFVLGAKPSSNAIVVKGDHNFPFGTTFKRALWTLQRRYPEYVRTFSEDYDDFIDLVESTPNVMTHYYFQNKHYIGCSTTISNVENSTEEVDNIINHFNKIFKTEPECNKEEHVYKWTDSRGSQAMVKIANENALQVIKITTSAPQSH